MGETTHDIELDGHQVTKWFRSWSRDEPAREWRALGLLARVAPGLSARPLTLGEREGRPLVVMTRLPGRALGDEPLSLDQVDALGHALRSLHTSVPADDLARLPTRIWSARDTLEFLRLNVSSTSVVDEPIVEQALRAGERWTRTADAEVLLQTPVPVFAQADGNLANAIWDGSVCRLVDFEDSGVGDRAWEIADLLEHVSVRLTGVLDEARLLDALDMEDVTAARLTPARTAFALLWLTVLLPGGPGHHRNPEGSYRRQSERVLGLLGG